MTKLGAGKAAGWAGRGEVLKQAGSCHGQFRSLGQRAEPLLEQEVWKGRKNKWEIARWGEKDQEGKICFLCPVLAGVGTRWPLRCFPTQIVLWFCDDSCCPGHFLSRRELSWHPWIPVFSWSAQRHGKILFLGIVSWGGRWRWEEQGLTPLLVAFQRGALICSAALSGPVAASLKLLLLFWPATHQAGQAVGLL